MVRYWGEALGLRPAGGRLQVWGTIRPVFGVLHWIIRKGVNYSGRSWIIEPYFGSFDGLCVTGGRSFWIDVGQNFGGDLFQFVDGSLDSHKGFGVGVDGVVLNVNDIS